MTREGLMNYAVWIVRLVFMAWMLPAGLNHFVPLFPQPLGNQPLSKELFLALDDSHLFDLVKTVELLMGIALLTGWYLPLVLVLCMPVSFCVWYWDTALQGWGTFSAIYGWAVLLCNLFLCLAYVDHYRAMLAPRPVPQRPGAKGAEGRPLLLAGRLLFGAWMIASGVNFFFAHVYAMPAGTQPLAVELMSALAHSQLLDVAIGIQLAMGVLILVGLFVPVALCVTMPISVCAAYWAVMLEHEPVGALLALAAVGLNALLLFAHLDVFKGMFVRHARALGEVPLRYEDLFVKAGGRTARGQYVVPAIALLAVAAFYHFLVFGRSGEWAMLVLLVPAIVLHARRLHDMGRTAALLLLPGVTIAAAVWFHMFDPGAAAEKPAIIAALAISALVALWAVTGKGQSGPNRFGEAPT